MLVLDANILIRAVLGRRVRELLERYAVRGVRFLAPEAAFEEASKYLPMLLEKKGIPRDEADWPILATALGLGCGLWTEDQDFFGTGVAVWTTNRIEILLEQESSASGSERSELS